MAGNDHKMDTQGNIANFIERKVRDLLEYDMNEYQNPAWAQAAELFNEIFDINSIIDVCLKESS